MTGWSEVTASLAECTARLARLEKMANRLERRYEMVPTQGQVRWSEDEDDGVLQIVASSGTIVIELGGHCEGGGMLHLLTEAGRGTVELFTDSEGGNLSIRGVGGEQQLLLDASPEGGSCTLGSAAEQHGVWLNACGRPGELVLFDPPTGRGCVRMQSDATGGRAILGDDLSPSRIVLDTGPHGGRIKLIDNNLQINLAEKR